MDYVVIKKEDLEWLQYKAQRSCKSIYSTHRVQNIDTFPASELWEAARAKHWDDKDRDTFMVKTYPDLTDFLNTKKG